MLFISHWFILHDVLCTLPLPHAENRPWANLQYRVESSHCRGNDFVLHNPRVFFRFFWNERLRRLSGSVHWNKDTEGPPTGAHGASIMLVYDEILAYPVWRSGVTAFTVNMNVNLRKVIPLERSVPL